MAKTYLRTGRIAWSPLTDSQKTMLVTVANVGIGTTFSATLDSPTEQFLIGNGVISSPMSTTGLGPIEQAAVWRRSGTPDPTSGTFHYATDQVQSDSAGVIVVDSDATFVSNWGNPAPQVTEDGVYLIAINLAGTNAPDTRPSQTGDWQTVRTTGPVFLNGDGSNQTLFGQALGEQVAKSFVAWPLHEVAEAFLSVTVPLPAGAHVDLFSNLAMQGLHGGVAITPSYSMQGSIQRVASLS